MDIPTKAIINLQERTIQLEGSEEFVCKYLDEFKDKLSVQEWTQPTPKTPIQKGKISKEKEKKEKKTRLPTKVEIEEFDIKGDSKTNIPSLKEFINEKKPRSHQERITVVGYYFTNILKKGEEFSEGNTEFVYNALKFPKSRNPHQSHTDTKNHKRWIDKGSDLQHWKVTRLGEIHVEEEMPSKGEKGQN